MQGELDELEREEFFRLKKVQAKKKRDADINDAAVGPRWLQASRGRAPRLHCPC